MPRTQGQNHAPHTTGQKKQGNLSSSTLPASSMEGAPTCWVLCKHNKNVLFPKNLIILYKKKQWVSIGRWVIQGNNETHRVLVAKLFFRQHSKGRVCALLLHVSYMLYQLILGTDTTMHVKTKRMVIYPTLLNLQHNSKFLYKTEESTTFFPLTLCIWCFLYCSTRRANRRTGGAGRDL